MRAARLGLTRRAGPITLQNKPMKKSICTTLLSAGLVLTGLSTKAQGLEGVIVEEFHTITQADADLLNNDLGNSSFPIVAGSKVYRVYVDMAPNYRFLQVYSTNAGNAADFSTTTAFWNDDNFGSEFPAQTRRASTGTLFDSYITLGSTGTAGGASPCGALGSNAAQVGVPRTADTNGDLTSCGVFPGFSGNDGSIPGVVPALTTNLSGALDFTALTGSGNTFTWIDDAYATLPAGTGVDPAGTNRILIGQFTTDGAFSFHLNVDISDPNNVIESYFWANPVAGGSVSPFLTYPSACNAPVLSAPTSNGPICAGQALNLNASATGDATITYSWSGPNSFSSIAQNPTIAAATVAASGTYTVTASNGCAPNAVASVNVLVNPSTNNTTTISACDSYTWTVNGTTYTQSGTYTSVNGCGTETLVLTITPSTNNTTTVSECDSYTWAVNGTTYTASGTYTNVVGCATETLVLTITPSTNNTTTVSECDSYTWAVNGTTYTVSGTYTNVVGCATETLVLTILQSGNNTTTESACDSFTWSVNGTTYTQSGTYTAVTGCSTETLVLTITPSTNNTTTVSECDSYTWAVNGTTYTASGTYTNVVGCATETLVLTITPSTNNTTTETACATYTWAVNGTTYTQSGTYTSVNGCATETLILTVTIPGTACNDGNNGTINDTYDQNCNCVGVPTGCTENIILNITLDAFGSQTSWSLLQDGTATVVEAGGPYNDGMMGAVIIEELCVPAGCYRLVVNDAAGDGIVGGGYELLVSGTNARIIDNKANFSTGSVSAISGNQAFCLPLSNDGLLASSCDKLDWVNGQYMVAAPNAAVSAQWLVGNQSDDGYEFWIFDPNGSYSFRRFRNHANSDGFGPASATRACHMKVNNWAVSSQIPANVLMNVRVRSRVNGVNGAFGPACRMVINPVLAACPQTQLMNVPGASTFSCGVTRPFAPGSYIYARPVSGANRYQFRFSQPNEGVVAVRTSTNYILQLNWVTGALLAGETYDVEVRVSKNNGATWCTDAAVWGPVCQVTIGAPGAVLGGANFAGIADAAELRMFPNPNRGDVLNFSLSAIEEGVNTVSMDIYDLSGKRVSARTIAVADGNVNTVIDLNGELAAGMYLVNFTAGANVYTERLMIQP